MHFDLNVSTMELTLCIVMCLQSKLRKEGAEIERLKPIHFRYSFFVKSFDNLKHLVANSLFAVNLQSLRVEERLTLLDGMNKSL